MNTSEDPTRQPDGGSVEVRQARELAEYASLRDEALRAVDQSLSLQGFTLASVALVVGAAVGADLGGGTRLVLFCGLQILVLLIVIQIGARRRQNATISSYLVVFHGMEGRAWESRLRERRMREGPLAVDRWYGWGEAAFTVFIALVGLVGSIWAISLSDDLNSVALGLAIAVNVLGIVAIVAQVARKKFIQDLIGTEIEGWKLASEAEAAQ
jgi:hypothetical protein